MYVKKCIKGSHWNINKGNLTWWDSYFLLSVSVLLELSHIIYIIFLNTIKLKQKISIVAQFKSCTNEFPKGLIAHHKNAYNGCVKMYW